MQVWYIMRGRNEKIIFVLISALILWCSFSFVDIEQTKETIIVVEITTETTTVAETTTEKQNECIGVFTITAYCPCKKCCGVWAQNRPNGVVYTASGTKAKAERTIAVDPSIIPLGTKVIIDGHTYVAEDTGGAIKGKKIDIYFSSHEDACAFGKQTKEVFILS